MKLHLSRPDGLNRITSCGHGFVAVNGSKHPHSLIVTPRQIVAPWAVTEFAALDEAAVEQLLAHRPELVLIGTGTTLSFPPAEVLRPLIAAHLGYEIMDTGAACRTYNILLAEGRQVLAALIVT